MSSLKPFIAMTAGALMLAGCSGFQTFLTNANTQANTIFPLIGKDLIMVANILVQAECSPATPVAGQTLVNILKVVAPNSKSANEVQGILATNASVAAQLCPYVASIRASVGSVPVGVPSQVIAAK